MRGLLCGVHAATCHSAGSVAGSTDREWYRMTWYSEPALRGVRLAAAWLGVQGAA